VTEDTMMRIPAVLAATGMKRTTLYLAIRRGDFPAPRKISRRAVAWRRADVEKWMSARPSAVAQANS
jgi:prophage regulatory protein